MKLSVIALDYDGTISDGEGLHPAVRDALADARTRGVIVMLVTGRVLEDLRRVAGDLHFVDGVVAENGAVVHFPDSNYTWVVAQGVPEAFVAELRRRNVPISQGRCLVDSAAADAQRILEIVRQQELPLVLLFNRSRLMVRWIADVFGDNALARDLRAQEERFRSTGDADVLTEIVAAIRARYDLVEDEAA